MRVDVLVASADLAQALDFGVALRGEIFEPVLACTPDVLRRAADSDDAIVCLTGVENAEGLRLFLTGEPNAVIVGPAGGFTHDQEAILDEFEAIYLEYGTAPIVVIAALTALIHSQSLAPRGRAPLRGSRAEPGSKQDPWQE